jgi:beta-hydroxyacyl-ACP dehydratase FabZ
VDRIIELTPLQRIVGIKQVSINESFFQGHFPGAPLMPAVLTVESLSQVAAILLLQREEAPPNFRVYLRGVNDAKFRRQVVPGDRLRLEISLGRRRASLARAQAIAYVGDQVVAEAGLLLALIDATEIHPSAIVHGKARIGAEPSSGRMRRLAPTCGLARAARLEPRPLSTAGPTSGTARSFTRSPRSA